MESILGQGLVDVQRQSVRTELFARDRQDDLVASLIAPHAEIVTALPMLAATEESAEDLQEAVDMDQSDMETEGDHGAGGVGPDLTATSNVSVVNSE